VFPGKLITVAGGRFPTYINVTSCGFHADQMSASIKKQIHAGLSMPRLYIHRESICQTSSDIDDALTRCDTIYFFRLLWGKKVKWQRFLMQLVSLQW